MLPVLLLSLVAFVAAEAADWSNIGSETLVFKNPQLSIKVKESAPPCSEIRFRSTGDMVNLKSVKMIFDDGSSQEVEIKTALRSGVTSDPIEVDGGPKDLGSVEIIHTSTGRGASSRATITVQGHG